MNKLVSETYGTARFRGIQQCLFRNGEWVLKHQKITPVSQRWVRTLPRTFSSGHRNLKHAFSHVLVKIYWVPENRVPHSSMNKLVSETYCTARFRGIQHCLVRNGEWVSQNDTLSATVSEKVLSHMLALGPLETLGSLFRQSRGSLGQQEV